MKNLSQKLTILLFIAGICLPVPLWWLTHGLFKSSGSEYRTLAEKPVLTAASYKSYAKDYESYFNDHLPFRDQLIGVQSLGDYLLFGRSNEKVIAGKDNWLFYCYKGDGDPIGCYRGKNLYTDAQLDKITENCLKMKESMDKKGGRFILLILPNKERVYSEYMPDKYGLPAEEYQAKQVIDHLRKNTDIEVIYGYDALKEASETLPVWYKTDTHWNNVGAYVGCRLVFDSLGIESPEAESFELTVSGDMKGDLARMLHIPDLLIKPDPDHELKGCPVGTCLNPYAAYDENSLWTSENADNRKLYLIQDSFGDALIPYLSAGFSESCSSRWRYISEENRNFSGFDPDVLIYETVERYIGDLLDLSFE